VKTLALVPIGVLAYASVACAGLDPACAVAKHLVHADVGLPRAAATLDKHHELAISVAGTASSTLPGPDGARWAYPAQLEKVLNAQFKGLSVKVVSAAKQKQSAIEMVAQFDRLLVDEKPNLVIWQTGTVDAIRGIDPEDFRAALAAGIDKLQDAGTDVVLMNMQYSPRTESMIAEDVYAETLHAVALEREVPLFDRLAVMKEWSDLGTFDLYSGTKDPETAEQVHACIGQLLADLIIQAIDLGREAEASTITKETK
jgi:hypothetical protein